MSSLPPSIGGSSFRGVIGVAREDITPPAGIYAKCWGAAKHDVAEGIHRPLTLTTLTLERTRVDVPSPLVLMSVDLMSWRSREAESAVIGRILREGPVPRERLMFCLTHPHAVPSLRSEDSERPGGDLIEPYRESLVEKALRSIREAQVQKREATLTWRYGACDLATNRDLPEPGGNRIICGFNPAAPADDTLLVGRIADDAGRIIATIVNYACHPTTLAWDNRFISPDYVGAMCEVVESHTDGAPCLFLQGASGELAPAEQYVGDPQVADRHGRRLGYAVLSTLEAMEPAGSRLAYHGIVESGAPLAVWRREDGPVSTALAAQVRTVELPLKPGPSAAELEEQWRRCDDPIEKERLWRRRAVRTLVGEGATARVPLWVWRLGDAYLVGQPNEAYSQFQIDLRKQSPGAVAVMNLVNGSIGYLPPRELYDRDIYQVTQTPFDRGSLEKLAEIAQQAIRSLFVETSEVQ